jgi:hypothetical protein
VAKDKRNPLRTLAEDTEKAVRRGEKLEKTLLKIVAQSEAGSAAEEFLKAVQRGVKALKKEAKKTDRPLRVVKKKAADESKPAPSPATPAKASPRPAVKRARKKPQANAAQVAEPAASNE